MTVGRRVGIAVCALLGVVAREAGASPVTYQFNGRFSQAEFGSTQFSGTFTYDTNLPLYPGAAQDATHHYYAGADGTPVAMTLNLGSPGNNPLGTPTNSELVVTHSPAYDELNLDVSYRSTTGNQTNTATIGLLNNNGLAPGPFTSLDPPPSLSLSGFNLGNQLILFLPDGTTGTVVGTITSLSPLTSVPEPASALVFGAIVAGLVSRRARNGRRSS
jgi:hypothetical protein